MGNYPELGADVRNPAFYVGDLQGAQCEIRGRELPRQIVRALALCTG